MNTTHEPHELRRPMVAATIAVALCSALLFGQAFADTPARIDRVIDGDTYDATLYLYPGLEMRARLRLAGWDTPEVRGACEKERALARRATHKARQWFAEEAMRVDVDIDSVDAFGRAVAHIHGLGEWLAEQGLARPFKRGRAEGWCDG